MRAELAASQKAGSALLKEVEMVKAGLAEAKKAAEDEGHGIAHITRTLESIEKIVKDFEQKHDMDLYLQVGVHVVTYLGILAHAVVQLDMKVGRHANTHHAS